MTQRLPLVMNAGRIQQLQSADSLITNITTPTPGLTNVLINGAFDVWQRGTSFTGVSNGTYVADRWLSMSSNDATYNFASDSTVPTIAQVGRQLSATLKVNVTSADTSIGSTQFLSVAQKIEGYNWALIAQQACVLSFWVRSNLTGTYCVSLNNSGSDKSFVAEYTINSANTWEYKTIAIPASPSGGTWNYTTGVGVILGFGLACGSTLQGTAGSWGSALAYGTSNQVNWLNSTSNVFYLACVQLEAGSTASPFVHQRYSDVLAECERYYQISGPAGFVGTTINSATAIGRLSAPLRRVMRAAPSISFSGLCGIWVPSLSATRDVTSIGTNSSNAYSVQFDVNTASGWGSSNGALALGFDDGSGLFLFTSEL